MDLPKATRSFAFFVARYCATAGFFEVGGLAPEGPRRRVGERARNQGLSLSRQTPAQEGKSGETLDTVKLRLQSTVGPSRHCS